MAAVKEYDFVVTLKHPDYRPYNLISLLMCVMSIVASVLGIMNTYLKSTFWLIIILNVFIVAYLVMILFNSRRKDFVVTFRWALVASALLWFLPPLDNFLIAIVYIIASFIERQVKFPQEVGFTKDEITINSFPQKHYNWKEAQNIVLKDNLLTIDFKNNKILQKQTESDVDATTEKEFNEFCRQQINNPV